jgi:hypothetical protein
MIKGLTGTLGVTIAGGSTTMPYVPQNASNPIQGMIRVNNQDLEVFTGSSWQVMSTSYASVGLDQDVLDVIQWARKQRDKQLDRERRIENNPALKKAYEAVQRAEANYEILDKIVGEDGNHTTPA